VPLAPLQGHQVFQVATLLLPKSIPIIKTKPPESKRLGGFPQFFASATPSTQAPRKIEKNLKKSILFTAQKSQI
jgi:hypothetical protein